MRLPERPAPMALDQSLPRLGFGVTGPHASSVTAPQHTILLVQEAIERGVTLFDTGPMYGGGEGERRLGRAIAGAPRDVLTVITKARTRTADGARQSLTVSLEQSLERMGVGYIDALLLHGPAPTDIEDPAVVMELRGLLSQGLARRIGVCGRGLERAAMLKYAARDDLFSLLMTPLDDPQLLAQAQHLGVSVLAIETMRSQAAAYRMPRSRADLWYLARTLRDAAQKRHQGEGIGIGPALALPSVASVIVTTTRLANLEKNIAAARLRETL
ncbi:MAG: aldo/keto reductase [Caulobacterales bacterium]